MNTRALLANCAWLASGIPAWLRFRRALDHPARTQEHLLRNLLARNAESAYGRAFGFGEIDDYAQYSERVPVVDYEDLEPWIERTMRGEPSVLTSSPVTHLVPTSGSSGARKLIPFTPALQDEFNAAIGPWMVDLYREYPSLLKGTAYWSISPAIPELQNENSGVPIGFENDSNYLGGVRQMLAGAIFAAPSALRLAPDMESFRYLTLLCLLRRRDLGLVSVWHPSFLTLLFEALPARWVELLDDIAGGGCTRARGFHPELRRAVQTPPCPARRDELLSANPTMPHTLWPNMKIVSCWGDAQAALPMASLQKRLPGVAVQAKGLLATEAFVTIPFQGTHPLAVTSHFFEFCDTHGKIRRAHELQRGGIYSVIVTTAGGLWRYRLGDRVQVDDFLAGTPCLHFLGREGNVSDLYGEKLSEGFVCEAIGKACAALRCTPEFAMLAPDIDAGGARNYTLFFEGPPVAAIAGQLELEMKKNPHYALCRDLGQLGPLRCFHIAGGGYETFVSASMAGGQRLGDVKPHALSQRTDWPDRFSGNYIRLEPINAFFQQQGHVD